MSLLSDRLLYVHDALDTAELPHAFGGAIALAYCTHEPRGTRDIDVNVFVGVERIEATLQALAVEPVKAPERARAKRDGQIRVFLKDTPLDLFFSTDEFHRDAAQDIREVEFFGRIIPILSCQSLAVFKIMFNRTKDWADIEAMHEAGQLNIGELARQLDLFVAHDDSRIERLRRLL